MYLNYSINLESRFDIKIKLDTTERDKSGIITVLTQGRSYPGADFYVLPLLWGSVQE